MATRIEEARRARWLAPLLLAVLAGCAGSPPRTTTGTSEPAPADEAGCNAAGGRWQAIGRMQHWVCLVDYTDAGRRCSDHSQCQGLCLLDPGQGAEAGQRVQGSCQRDASQRFGCHQPVEHGRAGPAICVD